MMIGQVDLSCAEYATPHKKTEPTLIRTRLSQRVARELERTLGIESNRVRLAGDSHRKHTK